MTKYAREDCCYEEMTSKVGGQSQPQDCFDEPYENKYEESRKRNEGLDWSGMDGHD